jgi:hypothetical protein
LEAIQDDEDDDQQINLDNLNDEEEDLQDSWLFYKFNEFFRILLFVGFREFDLFSYFLIVQAAFDTHTSTRLEENFQTFSKPFTSDDTFSKS